MRAKIPPRDFTDIFAVKFISLVEFRQMKFHRGFCRVNLADKIPNRVSRFGIPRRFLKFGISSEILFWISLRFRDKILYRLQISALPHADYRVKSGDPSGRPQSFASVRPGKARLPRSFRPFWMQTIFSTRVPSPSWRSCAPAKVSALASTRWAERRDHTWAAAKI